MHPQQATLKVNDPDALDIGAAYLRLPPQGRIEITCSSNRIAWTMTGLEDAGFFAIKLLGLNRTRSSARLCALKGKEGACHDSGRTASYLGAAAAVLDDDNHLLDGSISVCEKTARLYALPVYRDYVAISEPDSVLYTRLATNPEPFDCDNLELVAGKLSRRLKIPTASKHELVPVMYPGPFRLIILEDGSMLKRGEAVQVTPEQAGMLQKSKEALGLQKKSFAATGLRAARNYVAAFKSQGLLCLYDQQQAGHVVAGTGAAGIGETNYQALDSLDERTRAKLKKLIGTDDNFFVLTGSDPADEYGCCPSTEVGSANRLVEAGVLVSLNWPAPPGSCPTTVYAFAGEIEQIEGQPKFSTNAGVRQAVHDRLDSPKRKMGLVLKNILRVALLLFAGFAVVFQLRKPPDQNRPPLVAPQNGVAVYFFHTAVRCRACFDMEAFTESTLEQYFADETEKNELVYYQINIDNPRYRFLVDRYGIFASTVVLVRFEAGEQTVAKTLTAQVWQLHESRQEFISMLRHELAQVLEPPNE